MIKDISTFINKANSRPETIVLGKPVIEMRTYWEMLEPPDINLEFQLFFNILI